MPLGGLRETQLFTGVAYLAWIRHSTYATPQLRRIHLTSAGTNGLSIVTLTGMRSRGSASFVANMGAYPDNDGLPELLAEGPDAGSWVIFWSHTGYTTSTTVNMGNYGRML